MEYDVFKLIRRDHEDILRLFHETETFSREETFLKLTFTDLAKRLEKHFSAEEAAILTALEKRDKVRHLFLNLQEDITGMRGTLRSLVEHAFGTLKWKSTLLGLRQQFKHHADSVHNRVFPKLRENFNSNELTQLGKMFAEGQPAQKLTG